MNGESVLVIVLRRDEHDLSETEIAAIKELFPGREVVFRRTDPRDYQEHAAECEELKPAAVLLPMDRPVPLLALALEKGFPHLLYTPSGLLKIKPLPPLFKPFEPKA